MRRYRIHGLEVGSDLPMDAVQGSTGDADVVITLERKPAHPTPRETPVAEFRDGGGYSVWRSREGFRLLYPGLADFDVTTGAIRGRLQSSGEELGALLSCGTAIALAITARGGLVLHASAVVVRNQVVAFTGSSGMGKSTFAALASSAGAGLFADDVLSVTVASSGARVDQGATALRLRPGAAGIANLLPHWQQRRSVDGRVVLAPPDVPEWGSLPLRALVLPGYSDSGSALVRLQGAEALVELLRHPRVQGWRDPGYLTTSTQALARLARAVPVYRLAARRAPPFDRAVATSVWEQVCNL